MSLDEYKKYLKSSLTISEPKMMTYVIGNREPQEREGVRLLVKVKNTAPETYNSGNVVFVGVNLVITNRKEGMGSQSERWKIGVKRTPVNVNEEVRRKYSQGQLSLNERFPMYTSDEKKHGEMLFPGESVEYYLDVPPEEVPYFKMQVEGTLSRRHLFHVVQELKGFDEYASPIIEGIFTTLDKIQIAGRLVELASSIPEITKNSSFEDIDNLKDVINNITSVADTLMDETNVVYRSNKHIDVKDFIKQVWGKQIVAVQNACKDTLSTFSSNDPKLINDAADNLKTILLSSDECNKKQLEFIASLKITN